MYEEGLGQVPLPHMVRGQIAQLVKQTVAALNSIHRFSMGFCTDTIACNRFQSPYFDGEVLTILDGFQGLAEGQVLIRDFWR